MFPLCLVAVVLILIVLVPALASAQMQMPTQKAPQTQQEQAQAADANAMSMDMPGMDMPNKNRAVGALEQESSGTSVQPMSWGMPMVMTDTGGWKLGWMAQAFGVDVQESNVVAPSGAGHRGGDGFYSTTWGMLGATHRLGRGAVMLRTMLSLEPATITGRRYPELFQFGETAFGKPIDDGQHPHNLVMELGAQYARPVGKATVELYYAPVGDPALGPTAYPHRASAAELPQATLGHHYEDSTHIADDVLTGVLGWKSVRIEAGGFYGREPGENRWTVGWGAIDSWSSRVTWLPARDWQAQVSTGRLHHPEALSTGDEERTTASVEYAKGGRAASLIWGRDYKTDGRYSVNAFTAEGLLPIKNKNFLTGRFEWSQRDELFADAPAIEDSMPRWFGVTAYTAGYTRDVRQWRDAVVGVGANGTGYAYGDVRGALDAVYGRHPWGVSAYVRVRLRPADAQATR
jgi:hypothetical protein